jgi:PAS domain S-box-containing protein
MVPQISFLACLLDAVLARKRAGEEYSKGSGVRRETQRTLVLGLTLVLLLPRLVCASHPWSVLILHSYHKGYAWTEGEERGIKRAFSSHPETLFFVEYMDTKRVAFTSDYRKRIFQFYRFKYHGKRPDIVMVTDNNALTFIVEYHSGLFPGVPVVFCGVNNFKPSMLHGDPLITGVKEASSFTDTLRLALRLHPKASRIFVILDSNTVTSSLNEELLRRSLTSLHLSREVRFLKARDLAAILEEVGKIPEDSIVLMGSGFFRDGDGRILPMAKCGELISQTCSVPIYSFWDFMLGHGVVGGKLVSAVAQGEAAGAMALKVLSGTPVSEMPVCIRSPNRFMFDYRQLKRFGIKESELPRLGVMVNRPMPLPSKYRKFFLFMLVGLVVLGCWVFLLAVNIRSRKKMEERLQESEHRFRTLVEQSLVGVYLFNRERFLYANEALAQMTGYTMDEILSLRPLDIIYPADRPFVAEMIRRRLAGEMDAVRYALRGLCKDGGVIHCEVFGKRILHEGQVAILGTVVDVTDKVAKGEMLMHLTQEIGKLSKVSQELADVQSVDLWMEKSLPMVCEAAGADLVVIYRLEVDKPLLAGLFPEGGISCEDAVSLGECVCGRVLESGEGCFSSSVFEDLKCMLDLCNKTGIFSFAALPLRGYEGMMGLLGIGWRRERSFDEEERRYLEALAGGVALAWENALLYEKIQDHARRLEEVVDQRTAELRRTVEAEKRLNATLMELLKELEEARKRLEVTTGHLEESNKELETFAYTVSHDLRAPLRGMEGFAHALLEDYGDIMGNLGKDYARRIVEAAQSMDRLIQDLLEYSRLGRQEVSLRRVDLDQIMSEALSHLEAEIRERNVDIEVEMPLGTVKGHPALLTQVAANLLSNAVKFVSLEKRPRVRVWSQVEGEKIRFWVEDEGLGIDPKYHERIFGLFERLHGIESYPGTGVGLAIVKRAVERMGGEVGLLSREGEGSRFWVELERWKRK